MGIEIKLDKIVINEKELREIELVVYLSDGQIFKVEFQKDMWGETIGDNLGWLSEQIAKYVTEKHRAFDGPVDGEEIIKKLEDLTGYK